MLEPAAHHPCRLNVIPDCDICKRLIIASAWASLGLTGICCRRLRGSTWSYSFPWAHAHGYLLPPLRGSMGRPGVRPGIINYLKVRPPPWWADHTGVKQSEINNPFASLVPRRGSPQRLSGPWSALVDNSFFYCFRRAGLRGLALSALCCRLCGSTWSYPSPMALAGHSPTRARLTPTATCCRRSAAQWVTRAFARGLSIT